MGKNLTMYGDISPRTAAYALKQLIQDNPYLLVTELSADVKELPTNSSKTMQARCYENFDVPDAPLAEGTPPDGHKPTYRDVTCTLQQEGDFVELTDVINDTHEDPVMQENIRLSSVQAKETKEVRNFAKLKAGTTIYYAGNVNARGSVGAFTTRGQLRKVVRALKNNKAEYFTNLLKAGPNVATEPVAPCFLGYAHTDLESDIRDIDGFLPVEKYADSTKAYPGEIGKVENIRFIVTPLCEPWQDAGAAIGANGFISTSDVLNDVYPIIVVAPHAWATVPLKGKAAAKIMVVNPEQPAPGNPLGQSGSVGWKLWHGAMIQNDNYMARIEVCATENPA